MNAREPRDGAKGWCQNCGDAIHAERRNFGFMRANWRTVWVHHTGERHCRWVATPTPHVKNRPRTIPEQLAELRTLRFANKRGLDVS